MQNVLGMWFAARLHFAYWEHCKVYENQRATNDMVHRVRKIVAYFHKSAKGTEELQKIQVSLNLPQHKLIQDMETRWNSTYYMLKRIIEQRASISQYLEDHNVSVRPRWEWLEVGQGSDNCFSHFWKG